MAKHPNVIGEYTIKDPEQVVKLGMVIDDYKKSWLPRLWKEAEVTAVTKMPTLKVSDFFFQEETHNEKAKLIYSFRYYTPESNRVKTVKDNEAMT